MAANTLKWRRNSLNQYFLLQLQKHLFMNRILFAVTVFAIVGGALAFRTAGETPTVYCNTIAVCDEQHLVPFVVGRGPGQVFNPCVGMNVPYTIVYGICTSNTSGTFIPVEP